MVEWLANPWRLRRPACGNASGLDDTPTHTHIMIVDVCNGMHGRHYANGDDKRGEPAMYAGALTFTHCRALGAIDFGSFTHEGMRVVGWMTPRSACLVREPLPPGAKSTLRRARVFETLLTALTIAATKQGGVNLRGRTTEGLKGAIMYVIYVLLYRIKSTDDDNGDIR